MSSPGYFYTPEDQEQLAAIQRRQAYARQLLQNGSADPGSQAYGGLRNAGNSLLGAFLAKQADSKEADLAKASGSKYASDLGAFLTGSMGQPQPAQSPAAPSPQISNSAGSGPQMAASPAPGGPAPPAPSGPPAGIQAPPVGQPQMQPQQAQNPMQALVNTHNPYLMQQFGPKLFEHQMEINDRKVIPLSDQEAMSLGLRPGGVYGREAATGNLAVIQPSDMKSQGAIGQEQAQSRFTNQLPMTAEQKAQLGLGYAQLNKPEAVGFGSTLVNPHTGQVIYQSAPDEASISQMVDWSIAHGGQIPPNARSPAIQQAFNAALGQRLKSLGMTNDDLVNKNIGISARRGAAVQTSKLQAGTQINEDTVSGGMNILNGLLAKGAASPNSITSLNDLDQWAARHTNDPDAINLRNAIGTISNEYARVMTGTTSGSPSSDSARNEAASRLLTGYTKGTMQSVMGQMHYEMRQRSTAQHGALNQLTGGAYGGVGPSINYADPTATPNAPAGVDPKIWAHMTPQEKALWH